MRWRPAARALAALALVLPPAGAAAQVVAPTLADDLYQQALQSIAEGRGGDASAALARAIDAEPHHAGAWMELALLQCALGNAAEAERLFAAIEQRFDPPAGIRGLIASTRQKGCDSWDAHVQASLSAGRGIEQNVNQGAIDGTLTLISDGVPVSLAPLPEFLPRHDQFSAFSGELLRDLSRNGTVGFVQFQGRRYDSLHQFNSYSVFAGVETPWRLGNWSARGTALVGVVSLGGQLFQRQEQLQLRVVPPLAPGGGQLALVGAFSHIGYLTLTSFSGNTSELKGQYTYRGDAFTATVLGGAQRDHASGERPGGDRRGWLTTATVRGPLGGPFSAEAGAVRQTWASSTPYSAGVIDTVRHQATQVLRASLTYAFTREHSLQLEARQVRNRENISVFQYNDRLLQLSWQWNGF